MADNDLNTPINVDMTTLMRQLQQVVDTLAMSKQGAKDVTFALQQLKTAFGQVGSERINTNQFKQLMTEVKKIASLGLGDISSQFQTAVNNALVSGIKAQLKATQEAITAEINKAMRENAPASLAAKDVIGAGKYTATLAQASRTQEYMEMQRNPAGYLRDNDPQSLALRQKAQEEKLRAMEFTKATEASLNAERVLLERIKEKRENIIQLQREEAEQAKKIAQEEDKRLKAADRIRESIQRQQDQLKATDDPSKRAKVEEGIARQQINLARVTGSPAEMDQAIAAARKAAEATRDVSEAQNAAKKAQDERNKMLSKEAQLQQQVRYESDAVKKAKLEEALANAQLTRAIVTNDQALAHQAVTARDAARAAAQAAKPQQSIKDMAQHNFDVQWSKFNLNGGADLFAIQGRILANYQLMQTVINGFKFSLNYVIEIEAELAKLQGITGATTAGMVDLKTAITEIAMTSKYSTKEIAEAATVMAQAGYSAADISKTLKPITEFATATATGVKDAVDMITSAMTVFSLRTEEAGRVADMFTAALNNTKLDPQKLAMGLQYVSNVAAQSNVTLSELTSVLGALSNAGLKSGSIASTGLRQLIIDLSAPNKKLLDELYKLGLTEESVNIKTKGLVGVLTTLRDAGFSTASAMKTLEVRSANVYSAMLQQLDTVPELALAMNDAGGAAKGNAVNMNTLEAAIARFKNNYGTMSEEFFKPALTGFKNTLNLFSGMIGEMSKSPEVIRAVGAAFAAAFGASLLNNVSKLAIGLGSLVKFNPVLLGIGAAAGVAVLAFEAMSKSSRDGARSLDEIDASLEKVRGRLQSAKDDIRAADTEIARLAQRGENFNDAELPAIIQELRNRFADLGISIADGTKSVGELIDAILEVKRIAAERIKLDLQFEGFDLRERMKKALEGVDYGKSVVGFEKGGGATVSDFFKVRNRVVDNQTGDPNAAKLTQFDERIVGLEQDLFRYVNANGKDVDQNRMNQFAKSIADMMTDIERSNASKDQQRELTGALTSIKEMMRTFQGKIGEVNKTDRDTAKNEKEAVNADVERSDAYRAAQRVLADMQQVKTKMEAPLGNAEFSKDIGKVTDLKRNISAQMSAYMDTYKQLIAQSFSGKELDSEAIKKLNDEVQGLVATAESAAITAMREDKKEMAKFDQSSIAAAQARRKALQSLLHARTTATTDDATLNDIQRQLNDAVKAEFAARHKLLDDTRGPEAKTKGDYALIQREHDQLNQEMNDALARVKDDVENVRKVAKHLHNTTERYFTDLKNAFSSINSELEIALKNADLPVKQLKLLQETAKGPQNRNSVASIDIKAMEDRQVALEAEAAGRKAGDISLAIEKLDAIAKANRDKIKEINDDLDVQRQRANDEKNAQEKANVLSYISNRQQELNGYVSQQKNMEEKINGHKRDRGELLDKEAILTSKVTVTDDFGGSVMKAYDQWAEAQKLNADFMTQLREGLPAAFSTAQNSFGQFVANWASGTKNVAQSARDMVRDVLASMLQMTTNKLAGQLMGLALGAMFSGGSTGTSSGTGHVYTTPQAQVTGTPTIVVDSPNLMKADGGYIPYAAGSPGGVPGRDSVKALLMPGEYVLRKSAVDMVGRDTLDTINAMGNRVVQGVNAIATPMAPAEGSSGGVVNVYVVSKDQVPQLGPNDVVATIEDNIARKGSLRQLIKSVQMGQI